MLLGERERGKAMDDVRGEREGVREIKGDVGWEEKRNDRLRWGRKLEIIMRTHYFIKDIIIS